MNNTLIIAALAAGALLAFAIYRWTQRQRVHRVEGWVKEFLFARYRQHPGSLSINCTDDRLWPVLVAFETPVTGIRRRLQFACGGSPSTYTLLSEIDGERTAEGGT